MFRGVLIGVLLLLLLSLRFWFYYRDFVEYRDGDRAGLAARLIDDPQMKRGRQYFTVVDIKGIKISVVNNRVLPYHYGDSVFIDGIFTVRKGHYFVYNPRIYAIDSDHNFLSQFNTYIKSHSKSLLNTSIGPVSSSLLLGMVFGGNEGMPSEFMEKLRTTGVLHVTAASGMNVTLVAAVLVSIFGRLARRQIVLLLSILGVMFYAYLAGFEASIVRAMIMAVIAFGAAMFGKKYFGVLALFITGYIMLFYRPANLSDIGFQLSFLSTFGILWLKPLMPLQKNFLAGDVGTTLSAQIMTLPVILNTFGQYGVLSILVNACVLWTVPYLMILGALSIVGGWVFVPIGKFFAWLSFPFLLYFEKIVSFFADLNWVWEVGAFSSMFISSYYFILAAIVIAFKKWKKESGGLKVMDKGLERNR